MKHSDAINELAAALAKAQGDMGGASKDGSNPHFKSKYATLASIVDAIKAPLAANGIAYFQHPVTNDKDECGIETMLLHASGQWLAGEPFFVPVSKADAQGFGSALTYCRRYSLAAACGIAPEDDDGNAASAAKPARMPANEAKDWATLMGESTTLADLKGSYESAIAAARRYGDHAAEAEISKTKDAIKSILGGKNA